MKLFSSLFQKVRRFFSHLTNQIIATFLCVAVLVLSSTVILLYNNTAKVITENTISSTEVMLANINRSYMEYVQKVQQFALNIRMDNNILSILESPELTYSQLETLRSYIKTMYYTRHDLNELSVYLLPSKLRVTFSRHDRMLTTSYDQAPQLEPWYEQAIQEPYYTTTQPALKGTTVINKSAQSQDFIKIYRTIINAYTRTPIAIVEVTCNASILEEILNDLERQPSSLLLLTDLSGTAYYQSDPVQLSPEVIAEVIELSGSNELANTHFPMTLQEKPCLVVTNTSEDGSWRLTKLIPVVTLNGQITQTKNLSVIILIGAILLASIVIMLPVRLLTASLHRLAVQMQLAEKGDFSTTLPEKGNHEIRTLIHRYNTMIAKIDELIENNYRIQLNYKTTQLQALEAQINPHFLYNSFQVISSKAILEGNRDIYNMIEALAFNLRYAFKEGGLVSLAQELTYVSNYLFILQERFDGKLTFVQDVQPEATPAFIPKLTLFTMVENSVIHSYEKTGFPLEIKIVASLDGQTLVLSVSDNGPGIEPEVLERLTLIMERADTTVTPGKQVGLKNLRARLQLYFADRATVSLQSLPHFGTTTVVRILNCFEKE